VTRAVFELGGALASALPALEVGPWTSAPPGLVAFDADPAHPESRWRVDLARDDAAGRAALEDGERSVAQSHAALDAARWRLDRALAELARPPARGARELPRIETGLVAAVSGDPRTLPDQPVSWEVGATAQPRGAIERALQQVADLARGRARIETHVQGALVARTITTLSGDTEIWIAPRLELSGALLHARSVTVAVRTRDAWARVLAFVVSSAGRIAALGLPAAGLSALPAVWRFVRDVLREARARERRPVRG